MNLLRICTSCQIKHYENCRTCFGFGVKDIVHPDGLIPVNASTAEEIRIYGTLPAARVKRCPECGSNVYGIDEDS